MLSGPSQGRIGWDVQEQIGQWRKPTQATSIVIAGARLMVTMDNWIGAGVKCKIQALLPYL
jgi:hypothetical protein